MDRLDMVREFHKTYSAEIRESPDISGKKLQEMRVKLLREELGELIDALMQNDIVEAADALVDLEYVLLGAVISFGMSDVFNDMFKEVHSSNMSKLDENGEPIYREDGKVLKGPNYKGPNLEKFFSKKLKNG